MDDDEHDSKRRSNENYAGQSDVGDVVVSSVSGDDNDEIAAANEGTQC